MYTYTDNLIPIMTSMTTPSGRAFSSSYANSGNNADKAFDNSDTYGYVSGNGSVGHIGYEFVNPVRIGKYIVRSLSATYFPHMPKSWTFEGSNDGTNWTILDTQINQIWTTVNTDKEYIIDYSKAKSFKMYRLNWTANNGGPQVVINELKMFGVGYVDKFLISSEDKYCSINASDPNLNIIPSMTSNSTPSGYIVSANSENGGSTGANAAFRAVDGSLAPNGWVTAGSAPAWIKIELPSKKIVTKYGFMVNYRVNDCSPKNFIFQGSNDGNTWVNLDSRVDQTWTSDVFKYFEFKNKKGFSMYRVYISSNGGGLFVNLNELRLYESYSEYYIIPLGEKSYLDYGMSRNTEINMKREIDLIHQLNNRSEPLGSGKVFKQQIDRSKRRANKIILG
ncbi:MAG TPA: hypothetical protein DEF35_20805 [Paenibacillus sp.]|uniref:discoidin domain-containing protein n=1 Tax=Paenibacillus TaxID=44249 RepID=UPI000B9FF661|nr:MULTISPECIES: discoidin domain-containing protein [Paenibacillus]OZQ73011.1 hypothetical protein CA599_03995 [Paenibacillus taichungensis]HBU84058.1 hypothetical protein [Paenibacillus sp.]